MHFDDHVETGEVGEANGIEQVEFGALDIAYHQNPPAGEILKVAAFEPSTDCDPLAHSIKGSGDLAQLTGIGIDIEGVDVGIGQQPGQPHSVVTFRAPDV